MLRKPLPLLRRGRKKICWFCENRTEPDFKDFRDERILRKYISDRGKILPQRYSGTCTLHQRRLAVSIKRARHLAMLPFIAENIR